MDGASPTRVGAAGGGLRLVSGGRRTGAGHPPTLLGELGGTTARAARHGTTLHCPPRWARWRARALATRLVRQPPAS